MGRGDESNAGITLIKELNFLHCQVPVIVYCSMAAIRRYSDEAIRLGAYRVVNGTANITSLITDICGLSNWYRERRGWIKNEVYIYVQA